METGLQISWKQTRNIEDVKQLIDYGVLIKWGEMRTLKRSLNDHDQEEIVRYFVKRLCERTDDRLGCEIIVESLLIWFSHSLSEKLILAFFEQLFSEPNHDSACRIFVEISLTSELADTSHDSEMFDMAVAVVAELGVALVQYDKQFPGYLKNLKPTVSHITTYLLSVSNSNSACIRLSLLHYFGYMNLHMGDDISFNRVMNRFGHTVLDNLFTLLFNKKTEAVALLFLMENLTFVFSADAHCQRILHETFRYYMLKKPERFALFLQTFGSELAKEEPSELMLVFIQHLGALFKVVSEVNHKTLVKELIMTLQQFVNTPFRNALLDQILEDPGIRKQFKELVKLTRNVSSIDLGDSISQFKSSKRGRKPSFSKADPIGTLSQVTFLGGMEGLKVS